MKHKILPPLSPNGHFEELLFHHRGHGVWKEKNFDKIHTHLLVIQ